jgi:hypothetical protein
MRSDDGKAIGRTGWSPGFPNLGPTIFDRIDEIYRIGEKTNGTTSRSEKMRVFSAK